MWATPKTFSPSATLGPRETAAASWGARAFLGAWGCQRAVHTIHMTAEYSWDQADRLTILIRVGREKERPKR
jgi:hypothetical protein